MIIQLNELHGIGICYNAFKLIFNKSLDFGIVDWGQRMFLSAGVGTQVSCNSWTQDHVWKCFWKWWNRDVSLVHSSWDWAFIDNFEVQCFKSKQNAK